MNIQQEFERQLTNLLEKDYPQAARLSSTEFLALVEPLKDKLTNLDLPEVDIEKGFLPFVIVIKSNLISAEHQMSLVEKTGKKGITKLFPHESNDFQTIASETIPDASANLLINIDRGKETINFPPSEALPLIKSANRHPLTIDEGIAIITHFPEFLIKNNCFSLLASRHAGDQRVPAIWINAKKEPNLGWCWDGNPHTWLGSASCKERIGL